MRSTRDPRKLEQAVLQALNGVPVEEIEQRYAIERCELLPLAEAYRTAGQQALASPCKERWHYWRVPLNTSQPVDSLYASSSRHIEELLASELGPACIRLVGNGHISRWWFMRKNDGGVPHIRLRIFGSEPALSREAVPILGQELTRLEASGRIGHPTTLIYEPETAIFGGPAGIDLAHEIFHQDSHALQRWLLMEQNSDGPSVSRHRPEASMIVLHALLRGAGVDNFELLDVWTRVQTYRPWKTSATFEQRQKNLQVLTRLFREPARNLQAFLGQTQADIVLAWSHALAKQGEALAGENRAGHLQRGLRNILASHIIFHWNRLGFAIPMQAELATLGVLLHTESAG